MVVAGRIAPARTRLRPSLFCRHGAGAPLAIAGLLLRPRTSFPLTPHLASTTPVQLSQFLHTTSNT